MAREQKKDKGDNMNTAFIAIGSFYLGVMFGIVLICFLQNSCKMNNED